MNEIHANDWRAQARPGSNKKFRMLLSAAEMNMHSRHKNSCVLALHLRSDGSELQVCHDGVDLFVQERKGRHCGLRHSNLGPVTTQGLAFLQFFHDLVDLCFLASASNALHCVLGGHEGGGRESIKAAALVGIDGTEFSVGTTLFGVAHSETARLDDLGLFLAQNEHHVSAKEDIATAAYIVFLMGKASDIGFVWIFCHCC